MVLEIYKIINHPFDIAGTFYQEAWIKHNRRLLRKLESYIGNLYWD